MGYDPCYCNPLHTLPAATTIPIVCWIHMLLGMCTDGCISSAERPSRGLGLGFGLSKKFKAGITIWYLCAALEGYPYNSFSSNQNNWPCDWCSLLALVPSSDTRVNCWEVFCPKISANNSKLSYFVLFSACSTASEQEESLIICIKWRLLSPIY